MLVVRRAAVGGARSSPAGVTSLWLLTRHPRCTVLAVASTRVTQHVNAPRDVVYRALLDPIAVAKWRVPNGMTCQVHEFHAREDGSFRILLTYDDPTRTGKTAAQTDAYHGRFVKLVPDAQVVEAIEFETQDPSLRGEMTITTTLREADGGTEVEFLHDGTPHGVAPADNELGTRMALAKLAALLEHRPQ